MGVGYGSKGTGMTFRPSPFAAILAVGVVATVVILLQLSIRPNVPPHTMPTAPVTQQIRRALAPSQLPAPLGVPTVLILSPMKSAAKYLDGFFDNLRKLTHPHAAISLGFLHSGGAVAGDGITPNSSTWRR
jgi:Anp1